MIQSFNLFLLVVSASTKCPVPIVRVYISFGLDPFVLEISVFVLWVLSIHSVYFFMNIFVFYFFSRLTCDIFFFMFILEENHVKSVIFRHKKYK